MDPGRAPQTAAAGLIPGWSAGTYIYIYTHMVEYTTDSSSRADTMQAGQQGPIYIYIHTW